jgi:DNA-binding transcriptional LysR family regulator
VVDELAGIDLNLLVVLHALLEERHVTRAGQRVGLSQPTTSNALKRLRTQFKDPLLVRVGSRMELTPKAAALRERVGEALSAVRSALTDPQPFDPATATARLRISASDHGMVVLLAELERRLMVEAPGLEIDIIQFGAFDDAALLKSGELDIAVGTMVSVPPPLRRHELFYDEVVCLLRADHPALEPGTTPDDTLPLESFLAYPHVRVVPRRALAGSISEALSLRGHQRRVVCEVPHFLVAPFFLRYSDAITALSVRVAERFTRPLRLTTRRPPVKIAAFHTDLFWHPRSDGVEIHEWVRAQIFAIGTELARR